jgi:hypothetical protein
MSLYKSYKTDNKLETEGVTFELYDNRITMARAGASNPAFATSMNKRTQPYRRQIARNEMLPAKEAEIMRLVYADSIIQNWEVKDGDGWRQGIEGPDGTIPFTHENVVKTLEALPDLFMELQGLATSAQNYRKEQLESDAKN